MTDRALDNLLRQVLLDADNQEYGDAINELPEHDFSPAFEKKMQKLIRRANHPIRYRVAKAAACLLLAALLSGCTVLAVSPEARAAFVGWVREVSEGGFFYHYTGETQDTPTDVVYCPTWVPDGYELITEPKAEKTSVAIYANSKDDRITFLCSRVSESTSIQVERDGHEISQSVFVGDIPADLYIDQDENEASILVWWDETKGLSFVISAPLTGEELIKIAESVEAQEIPKPQVVFRPTWIPDGYQAVKTDDRDTSTYIFYENGEYAIIFSCIIDVDAATLYIQSVDGDVLHVKVGDLPADLHIDPEENASSAIVWTNENGYLLLIHGPLSGDELIRMAESVEAQEIPKPLEVYRPTWIPDGYSQALVPELSGQVNVLYKDDKGHTMLFAYSDSSTTLYLGSLESSIAPSKVTVNDIPADFYLDADDTQANFLVWVNPENDIIFWIGGNFSQDILIRIAESVEVVQ